MSRFHVTLGSDNNANWLGRFVLATIFDPD
jgi:hypothetical protein